MQKPSRAITQPTSTLPMAGSAQSLGQPGAGSTAAAQRLDWKRLPFSQKADTIWRLLSVNGYSPTLC